MELREIIKLNVLLFLFFIVPPVAGALLRGKRNWQRLLFFAMCFMTIGGFLKAEEWGYTLGNRPDYRGHARGFHFYFVDVAALTLIAAQVLEQWRKFRWFPPGLWLYVLYCAISLISVVNAPFPVYTWMAALKFFKVILVWVAVYNFIKSEDDLRFFLLAMGLTMCWELVAVLKMKYYDGFYQIRGTFEHQNSLAMYTCMIAMVLLAGGMAHHVRWGNFFFFSYLVCAVIVECTLSRAALAAFALGTVGVIGYSLWDRITRRRLALIGALSVAGMIGLLLAIDTIIIRFTQKGNEESKMTRVNLNAASREMASDYKLGIGWNNYAVAINHPFPYGRIIDDYELSFGHRPDPRYDKGVVECHYYLLLAETGLLSLLAYLALISLFLWWNVRAAFALRRRFAGAVSIGIAAGCGVNYLQSLLERVLTQPRNLFLWAMLLGVSGSIYTWHRQQLQQSKTASRALQRRPRMPMHYVGQPQENVALAENESTPPPS